MNNKNDNNYRRLFYYSTLLAWGKIPHPRATINQMKFAIEDRLVEINGKIGQLETDPEIPDNLKSLLLPTLVCRGVKVEEIVKVNSSMSKLGDPKTGDAGATLDGTTSTAENEGLLENLGDVFGEILELDLGGFLTEVGDTVEDFFTGGWF